MRERESNWYIIIWVSPPKQTHVTRTQIISTDSYCYRTRYKTVPIIGVTLPNNLPGPAPPITGQCRKKRAIDTASIMGESEWRNFEGCEVLATSVTMISFANAYQIPENKELWVMITFKIKIINSLLSKSINTQIHLLISTLSLSNNSNKGRKTTYNN